MRGELEVVERYVDVRVLVVLLVMTVEELSEWEERVERGRVAGKRGRGRTCAELRRVEGEERVEEEGEGPSQVD